MDDRASLLLRLSRRGALIGAAAALAGCNSAVDTLPQVALPALSGLTTGNGWAVPGIDTRRFAGRVTLLNVWASWCPYCRGEHDLLHKLARRPDVTLAGLVYRDSDDKVRDYLRQAGNPFAELSLDADHHLTKPLNQRGVPHTYVIGRDLKVLAKVPGALSDQAIDTILSPAIARARTS